MIVTPRHLLALAIAACAFSPVSAYASDGDPGEPEIGPVNYADSAGIEDLKKDVRRADQPESAKRYKGGLDLIEVKGANTYDDASTVFELRAKKLRTKDLVTFESQGAAIQQTSLVVTVHFNTGGRMEIGWDAYQGATAPHAYVWESDGDKSPEVFTCPEHDTSAGPASTQEADLKTSTLTYTIATDCWPEGVYAAELSGQTFWVKNNVPYVDDFAIEGERGRSGTMRLVARDEIPPQQS